MAGDGRSEPFARRRSGARSTDGNSLESLAVVMVCADEGCCGHARLIDALRPLVRRSRQAVLMRTTCVSADGCSGGRVGSMVRLQRCGGRTGASERGWLCGPFTDIAELGEVSAWLHEEEQRLGPRPT